MSSSRTTEQTDPVTWDEVLRHELSRLRPDLHLEAPGEKPAGSPEHPKRPDIEALRSLYTKIAASPQPLVALCLSGGGIRSATFNLGVLQRLAGIGVLGKFDYLSSVSGGGYIASWLRTWMRREGTAKVLEQLARPEKEATKDPLEPEPRPIVNLREYSNYLTPRLGLFSGDTWAAVAIVLRNLLLNWLVIIPLLTAAVGIPQLLLLVARTSIEPPWDRRILIAALVFEFLASLSVYAFRRFAKKPGTPQFAFIVGCVFPVCFAVGLLSTAGLGLDLPWHDESAPPGTHLGRLWGFAAVWCMVIPILGWGIIELISRARIAREKQAPPVRGATSAQQEQVQGQSAEQRQVSPVYELLALLISGAVAAAMLVGVTRFWLPYVYNRPALYVVLTAPVLLGIYLISRVLFVGIASRSEGWRREPKPGSSDDADREWWARLSGWLLLVLVSFAAVTTICLLGAHLPDYLGDYLAKKGGSDVAASLVKWLVGALGGAAGIIAALTGKSAKSEGSAGAKLPEDSKIPGWVLPVATPIFVVCVIIVLAWGLESLGEWVLNEPGLFDAAKDLERAGYAPLSVLVSAKFGGLMIVLALLAVLVGRSVNVNRFSMQSMYRNRLVRAYLGASNASTDEKSRRKPDPFTGFALDDNLSLHDLWAPAESGKRTAEQAATRPLPLINTTLNLVDGENLAWQQRKADSFCMTPFHCGNFRQGYRDSREYGGPFGISVGTAVSISGAAANPNMGYSSSPALGFLMALFNVRLGSWLGNTNANGARTYRLAGPRQAIFPLFAEIFGLTNSHRRYVSLSDGGHFDNLGLYEVVLRRCRRVLVSDAGCDGSFGFEDLGNAIRKIRIDLGVPIEFEKKIEIRGSQDTEEGLFCAIAKIRYSSVDGTSKDTDGDLIYIKPSIRGREGIVNPPSPETAIIPYDVYSYSRSSNTFPHESTADQWFSESQFESYRALGSHALTQISLDLRGASFDQLLEAVRKYIDWVKPTPPADGGK